MYLGTGVPAHAALLSIDLNAAGDGLLTHDGLTGLEWLDLPASARFGPGFPNFNTISAEFGPGGAFAAFRHASEFEISTLWSHAGIADQNAAVPSTNQSSAIYQLMSLMGQSGGQPLGGIDANA